MAGLRGFEGGLDGLEIAHLANQDDLGRLAAARRAKPG